jgi:predicted RNA-binding Zn ribbon-like protein
MTAQQIKDGDASVALFIADDLALDFVNSAYGVGDAHRECLDSDAQVLDWLRRAGLPAEAGSRGPRGALLMAALALRETARGLLEKRKAGASGDPTALNRVLALGSVYRELIWKRGHAPNYVQHRRAGNAVTLLVPVAEAIAELLAHADFDLVRRCEGSDCTLWYYDKTKSHHRRWCSMAACGNRMKVAAFRARQRA